MKLNIAEALKAGSFTKHEASSVKGKMHGCSSLTPSTIVSLAVTTFRCLKLKGFLQANLDGACEGKGRAAGTFGGILFDDEKERLEYFSGTLPAQLIRTWSRHGSRQNIFLVELLPVLIAKTVRSKGRSRMNQGWHCLLVSCHGNHGRCRGELLATASKWNKC
eukprot:1118115-Amphidinium_carterae.1